MQPALPRRRAPKAATGSKPALPEDRSGQRNPPLSPTRILGTTGRGPRDGSSLPNDHAAAIDGVVTPSRVCDLWLSKPLDRPFWSPSAPGTLPAQTEEGRHESKNLRFQVIANILGEVGCRGISPAPVSAARCRCIWQRTLEAGAQPGLAGSTTVGTTPLFFMRLRRLNGFARMMNPLML